MLQPLPGGRHESFTGLAVELVLISSSPCTDARVTNKKAAMALVSKDPTKKGNHDMSFE